MILKFCFLYLIINSLFCFAQEQEKQDSLVSQITGLKEMGGFFFPVLTADKLNIKTNELLYKDIKSKLTEKDTVGIRSYFDQIYNKNLIIKDIANNDVRINLYRQSYSYDLENDFISRAGWHYFLTVNTNTINQNPTPIYKSKFKIKNISQSYSDGYSSGYECYYYPNGQIRKYGKAGKNFKFLVDFPSDFFGPKKNPYEKRIQEVRIAFASFCPFIVFDETGMELSNVCYEDDIKMDLRDIIGIALNKFYENLPNINYSSSRKLGNSHEIEIKIVKAQVGLLWHIFSTGEHLTIVDDVSGKIIEEINKENIVYFTKQIPQKYFAHEYQQPSITDIYSNYENLIFKDFTPLTPINLDSRIHAMTRDMNQVKIVEKNGELVPEFSEDKTVFIETDAFINAKKYGVDSPFYFSKSNNQKSRDYGWSNLIRFISLKEDISNTTTYFDAFANYKFIPYFKYLEDKNIYFKNKQHLINPFLTDFTKSYTYYNNHIQQVSKNFTVEENYSLTNLIYPECFRNGIRPEYLERVHILSDKTFNEIIKKSSNYSFTYDYYPNGRLKHFKSILNSCAYEEDFIRKVVYNSNSGSQNCEGEKKTIKHTFNINQPVGTELWYDETGSLIKSIDHELTFNSRLFEVFYEANTIETDPKLNLTRFNYFLGDKNPYAKAFFSKNENGKYWIFNYAKKYIVIDANSNELLEKFDDFVLDDPRLQKYLNVNQSMNSPNN